MKKITMFLVIIGAYLYIKERVLMGSFAPGGEVLLPLFPVLLRQLYMGIKEVIRYDLKKGGI